MSKALQKNKLAKLATQINEGHRKVGAHVRATFEEAARVGGLLIEAKSLVKHGEWSAWLAGNFEGSETSARRYMRMNSRRAELEAKTTTVADLGIAEADRLLAEPKKAGSDPTSFSDDDDQPPEGDDIALINWHHRKYVESRDRQLRIALEALGKYAAVMPSQMLADFRQIVHDVTEEQAEVARWKRDKEALRNVQRCPHCGEYDWWITNKIGHWLYCIKHRVKWLVDSAALSDRHPSELDIEMGAEYGYITEKELRNYRKVNTQ